MFELSDEIRSLLDSADRYARDVMTSSVEPSWRTMVELGWLGISLEEANGGSGLPWSAAGKLIEAVAPALSDEPLISQLALSGYVLANSSSCAKRDELLQLMSNGQCKFSLAHLEARGGETFSQVPQMILSGSTSEYRLSGCKQAIVDGGNADYFLVSAHCESEDEIVIVALPRSNQGLHISTAATFDGRSLADLRCNDLIVAPSDVLALPNSMATIDQAQWLFAYLLMSESLGLAQTILRSTHEYLAQREQFGRKLVEFQVLQHRLVDMQLMVTRLSSQVELAGMQIDDNGIEASRHYIAASKIQGARAGQDVGKQAVQLHGAIGMTDELALGRYFKRMTANELLAGSTAEHQRFMQQVLRSRLAK